VVFRLVLRQQEKFLSALWSVEENCGTKAITFINIQQILGHIWRRMLKK
jgi:5-keto 4-deoxyuronate isomerase